METLCKYYGGSLLYGMATISSDVDVRGVYINTDPLYVFGFEKTQHVVKQDSEQDLALHEFANFVKGCTRGNPNFLETLHTPTHSFLELDEDFKRVVLDKASSFISSSAHYNVMCGYLKNEFKMATDSTRNCVGARRDAFDKYGYVPRSIMHMVRLTFSAQMFFEHGVYPTQVKDYCNCVHEDCMTLKLEPQQFTRFQAMNLVEGRMALMEHAYHNRKFDYTPDWDYIKSVFKYLYSQKMK